MDNLDLASIMIFYEYIFHFSFLISKKLINSGKGDTEANLTYINIKTDNTV